MASSTYHSIVIQAQEVTRKEALAGEASIKPGHLLEWSSGNLVTHNSAGGVLPNKLIALESPTPNDESNASIDVAYANGDRLYYAVGKPGEVYYMWLAAGENASKGSQLISDAAGGLTVATVDASTLANAIVGVAAEAKDNSGGGAAVRIKVEIV